MSMLDFIYKNPIVSTTTDFAKVTANALFWPKSSRTNTPKKMVPALPSTLIHSGNAFVRLAGVSGALSVILGAYGAHNLFTGEDKDELKRIFETANRYHFLHTLALLAVPMCRWQRTSGTLFIAGMLLFCGTCYYHALTGKSHLRRLTPVGGTLLICAWISMAL